MSLLRSSMRSCGSHHEGLASPKRGVYDMSMKASDEKQAEIPVTEAVEETVRERLKTIERDKQTAAPWDEVKRRILSRHPQP